MKRLLSLLVLGGLLLAVSPAAAEILEINKSISDSFVVSIPGQQTQLAANNIHTLSVRDVETLSGFDSLVLPIPISNAQIKNPSISSDSYAVRLLDAGDGYQYGSGLLGYNINYNADGSKKSVIVWLDLYSWDPGSRTGLRWIRLDGAGPNMPGIIIAGPDNPPDAPVTFQTKRPSYSSLYTVPGEYIIRYRHSWRHEISANLTGSSFLGNNSLISLNRYGYYSKILVRDGQNLTKYDNSGYDNLEIPAHGTPVYVSIFGDERWWNRTYFGPPPDQSDPIPEEPPEGWFTLVLNCSEAALYGPIQATLSPSDTAPSYDCVYWNWDSYHLHDEAQYRLINGQWYLTTYNGTSQAYENTPTDDDPLVRSISFPDEGKNNICVRVYNLATKQKLADLREYVQVSGESSTYWPLYVGVYDGVTGKALLNVNCEIKNLNTGETTTKTIQRNYFGENLQLNAADAYKISISKNGYESRTWDRLTSRTTKITAYLPKLADPEHPDQIKIYLTVAEPGGQPIPGATVQVSGLPVAVTNAQGQVQITATANTTYQYTVSKTGYIGASDTLTTLSTSFWQVIHLTPEGAVPTTDPAPGQTVAPGTTPDYRTVDQKATSALDILFGNVELIAALAGLILVCNMLTWILPGGGRRR